MFDLSNIFKANIYLYYSNFYYRNKTIKILQNTPIRNELLHVFNILQKFFNIRNEI